MLLPDLKFLNISARGERVAKRARSPSPHAVPRASESWCDVLYPYKSDPKTLSNDQSLSYEYTQHFMKGQRKTYKLFNVLHFDLGNVSGDPAAEMHFYAGYKNNASKPGDMPALYRLLMAKKEATNHEGATTTLTYTQSKRCVKIDVLEDEKTMHIVDLFYSIEPPNTVRSLCAIDVRKDLKVGQVVPDMLLSIAGDLGFEYVSLSDESDFTVDKVPWWTTAGMTTYLRIKRGYGIYDRFGISEISYDYPDIDKDEAVCRQQILLDLYHAIVTTPISLLYARMAAPENSLLDDGKYVEKFPHSRLFIREKQNEFDDLYKRLGYTLKYEFANQSIRDTLVRFEEQVKDYRPTKEFDDVHSLKYDWRTAAEAALKDTRVSFEEESVGFETLVNTLSSVFKQHRHKRTKIFGSGTDDSAIVSCKPGKAGQAPIAYLQTTKRKFIATTL